LTTYKRLPWIKLIVDGNKTKEEAFKESGHPGRMEDYNTFVIEIVDPPKITDAGGFKSSLHPAQTN
jgi:hypothetical protein